MHRSKNGVCECAECGEWFSSADLYQQHIATHNGKRAVLSVCHCNVINDGHNSNNDPRPHTPYKSNNSSP